MHLKKNHYGGVKVPQQHHGGIQHNAPLELYIQGGGTLPRSQPGQSHKFPPEQVQLRKTRWAPNEEPKRTEMPTLQEV